MSTFSGDRKVKAEIIGVGTELLLGHTINTDAAHVARELASLGIEVLHMQVVGDNAARLEAAFLEALGRSDIVIATGGLGPTGDDLTKETAAKIANRSMRMDEHSRQRLLEYFGERPITPNQLKQACMPEGATVFDNDHGTAPGCAVPVDGNRFIILLPGPPAELLPMLENEVRPFLQKLNNESIYSAMIRTFGIGEGAAAQALGKLLEGANPTAATYAANGEMFVKVTAKGGNAAEAQKIARPLINQVCSVLGDVVYGINVPSLEHVVVRELINRKMTIATAESCTGGLLASRITDEPGASAVFGLGLVAYANNVKEGILHVPGELLRSWGAVSAQVAVSMAKNIRRLNQSDLGLGITGIAGPDGGSAEKPLGLVYIALAHAGGCLVREMRPQGRYQGRAWVRRRAASHALDMVRRILLDLPPDIQTR